MSKKRNLLIYTFRTFPFQESLRKLVGPFFVFGSLKKDFKIFERIVSKRKPAIILGLARSTTQNSYFEARTVNRFNQKGIISKTGPRAVRLSVPPRRGTGIKLAGRPSSGFCNWTMYKIAEMVLEQPEVRFVFAHVKGEDLDAVLRLIETEMR